jgi:xanthine dehydrogenase accessory factor
MSRLMQTICSLLEQGEDLVLATILSHEGSVPRTAGTKMIVRRDGDSIATIGGGLVEGEVIQIADEVFETRSSRIREYDLTGANTESMDLVCGGRLEILVEFLEASPENLRIFKALRDGLRGRRKSMLVADLGLEGEPPDTVTRWLMIDDNVPIGDFSPPPKLVEHLRTWTGKERYPVVLSLDGRRYLVEPSFVLGTVYLFGAGHVSQQVAPLAKLVDFGIVVLDDRPEFANRERFPQADDVKVIDRFEGAFQELDIDEDSYLVIVTRGHLHDMTVLEQALRTKAGYVGMIGSRRKRDHIYTQLEKSGFREKDLARVFSPIGTDISAQTPEEIGISIVGELIKARAGQMQ